MVHLNSRKLICIRTALSYAINEVSLLDDQIMKCCYGCLKSEQIHLILL